jgi:hypothetical protein
MTELHDLIAAFAAIVAHGDDGRLTRAAAREGRRVLAACDRSIASVGECWSHRPKLDISGGSVEPAASERCTMMVSAQRPYR